MREKLLSYIGFKCDVDLAKMLKVRANEVGLREADVARFVMRRGLQEPVKILPHKVSVGTVE
jgi:hypothetical protein